MASLAGFGATCTVHAGGPPDLTVVQQPEVRGRGRRFVNVWDWLNILGSAGFVACLTPQMVRTLRLRRADDLSLAFLVLVLVSSVCMMLYSAERENYIFAGAQVANLIVWGTVLYFKLRPSGAKPAAA
jgi:uncharacterized protein with PQ loop repeat